jgi:hypothetical protein
VAASAVPPMRLPHETRTAVHAVLLAALVSAGKRARAAGCPPEVLFDVLDARLRSAAEEGRGDRDVPGARLGSAAGDGCRRPGSTGDVLDAPPWSAAEEGRGDRDVPGARWCSAAGDGCRKPGSAGDAGRHDRCAPPCSPAGGPILNSPPWSAAEDGQDRRHDPVEPGLVGESGG